MQTIRCLIETFSPDAVVETGTCLGYSTRWFAELAPVHTVEIDRGFYAAAQSRLRDLGNVTIYNGHSVAGLERIARDGTVNRPFAYLDAHWEADLPLADEFKVLASRWAEVIGAVDDFLVPGEDYGYDEYERPLSLDVFPVPVGAVAAYPSVSAEQETGHRRGTLYFGWGEAGAAAIGSAVEARLLRYA